MLSHWWWTLSIFTDFSSFLSWCSEFLLFHYFDFLFYVLCPLVRSWGFCTWLIHCKYCMSVIFICTLPLLFLCVSEFASFRLRVSFVFTILPLTLVFDSLLDSYYLLSVGYITVPQGVLNIDQSTLSDFCYFPIWLLHDWGGISHQWEYLGTRSMWEYFTSSTGGSFFFWNW